MKNEEVSLLLRIGSFELPLLIGKFQQPLGLSIVSSHELPLRCTDGKEEDREGKLQRRLGEPLKEFGSVTKFVSVSRFASTFVLRAYRKGLLD